MFVGGWPVIEGESWVADTFDWQKTGFQFLRSGFEYGFNSFFHIGVGPDPGNSAKFMIHVVQPNQLIIPDILMKNGWEVPAVKAYYGYIKNVAKKFGANQLTVDEEIKEVIDLAIAISKIKIPPEEIRNHSSVTNLMTIRELQEAYPYVDWLDFINNVIYSEKKRRPDDIVNVMVPKYLKELKSIPQAQTQSFQVAFGALYIRNFFDAESKTTVADMVNNIKNEVEENIKKLDWMDDTTKKRALKKGKATKEYIAYPDELLDDAKIENYYEELNIDPENYLESMLNVTAMTAKSYLNMDKPLNPSSWKMFNPADVNAAYMLQLNVFAIKAGVLQGVLFSSSRPQVMNYGSIGIAIGHEMMHAFDDQGSQYDENGNLVDWWEPETKEIFVTKAFCIVDQYANVTVPEIDTKLNRIITLGENIADNAAVKLVYLAYKKWAASRENDLPQMPYTPEQLFWISLGISWCSNDRPEILMNQVMNDPHSPNRYRVNIPLMNSEYFAEDFKCPIGSPINPKNKCVVW